MRSVGAVRRRRTAALAVGICILAAALAAPGPGSAAPDRTAVPAQDHTGGLKAEYDEVIGLEAEMVQKLEQLTAERERMTAEVRQLDQDLAQKKSDLIEAQRQLKRSEDVELLQAALLQEAQKQVAQSEERLRDQVVASYVTGGEDMSAIGEILQADSPEEAERALAYSRAVVGDTDQLVANLEAAKDKRDEASRSATSAKQEATEARDTIFTATSFIAEVRDRKATLLLDVGRAELEEAEQLRQVQARKVLVEGRINSMQTTSDGVGMLLAVRQQHQPDFVPGDLEVTNPLPGYHIGSQFGMRHHPILNISRLHAGGDMGAPTGTPIYAAADGIVVLASERGGYGNCTLIDHGNSLATLYGHQSEIVVQPGQQVERGDLIGYVGSTGLSTGPHLHLETRIKGMPVDPMGIIDFEADLHYGPDA